MSVPAAYLGIVLIWGTTPLAIKWSGEGVGYLFGVTGRMVIGVTLALLVLRLIGRPLVWHKRARSTYLAAGLGIFIAMTAVYWASQFIPSGWISVVFGLSPIVTGLMARIWLQETGLDLQRFLAVLIALVGLATIFSVGIELGLGFVLGLIGVLISVITQSASAVWIKRIDAQLHGLVVTAGGLLVAVPLFLLTWFLQGESWPLVIEQRALTSIVYLGVVGSVLGFALYFYVLRHVETTKVALITLMTPVIALMAGNWLNAEQVDAKVWAGTALIMLGLAGFELGGRIRTQLRSSKARESVGQ
ncbi:MAG: EamA family transporter [gamma proteobacterium symbiont of Ctena orbiculata]|uniref:DMT family transporter n=1 Tax=Candidatus Thiodiazotropha taylori TaxID=2792791 RepID=A0A944MBM8_9GAMM|nr:DMT family transporter [Candidatus Thiodiazotropha taylori]PUB89953.1 MAG: EamA family transporter [gamma proteobacterium symbiont of Ctena orbiculata]MBT2988928.1 DMT family transporter [Candidatus Thiodiazotropha taylori]MBT2996426.1 DMT family transporter [Candidatus Thiodiazotropha taylori]MBT3000140.1 DMT family transporter [Candidatus Thiodiazotropha taylori]